MQQNPLLLLALENCKKWKEKQIFIILPWSPPNIHHSVPKGKILKDWNSWNKNFRFISSEIIILVGLIFVDSSSTRNKSSLLLFMFLWGYDLRRLQVSEVIVTTAWILLKDHNVAKQLYSNLKKKKEIWCNHTLNHI